MSRPGACNHRTDGFFTHSQFCGDIFLHDPINQNPADCFDILAAKFI